MKTITLILLAGLCGCSVSYLIKVPTTPAKPRVARLGWVHIQKIMLPLFENICDESSNPMVKRLAEEFTWDPADYLKDKVVETVQGLKSGKGLLAKGEIFTETNIDHSNEFRAIYEVLYYAKDFDTFHKAACWARQNVNCGIFIDAIYLALITRKDIERVSVPAPYQLIPNYFMNKDAIIKASAIMNGEDVTTMDGVRDDGNAYIIDTNYTSNAYEDIQDTTLSYFHEDIGLNSYFFLNKLKQLSWVDSEFQNNARYGEHVYYFLKQLMARYYLERYSNDLYDLKGITWDDTEFTAYDPMLIYSNGKDFCYRPSNIAMNNDLVSSLKNIEHNIAITVARMRDGGSSKVAILNQLIKILLTNSNSYMNLAIDAVSNDSAESSAPSALSHYMTKIRDPIYWRINKKVVDLIDDALKSLPGYAKNQLYFPGVQITNVDVKKMVTSFDKFEFDITEAMKISDKDPNFQIKVSETRLNHKPFAIKVNVSSLVIQKGLMKIYLGPKVLPGDMSEKRKQFMLLDSFEINLKRGSNIITRTSDEINDISDDFVPLETIGKGVMDSEFGVDALPLKTVRTQLGFPSRLLLPRGSTSGMPFQIFVFIAPYTKAVPGGVKSIELNYDAILSPGYPLDLDVEMQEIFSLPNALVKDIVITNKIESVGKPTATSYGRGGGEFGGEKRWQPKEEIDTGIVTEPFATRPVLKLPFDFKSRKGQFEIKVNDQITKGDDMNTSPAENKKDIEINKAFTITDNKRDSTEYNINKLIKDDDGDLDRKVKIIKDSLKEIVITDDTKGREELEVSPIVATPRLMSALKKHFPSIFHIILKPTIDEDSVEKVYV